MTACETEPTDLVARHGEVDSETNTGTDSARPVRVTFVRVGFESEETLLIVAVAGATGMVGSMLSRALEAAGHAVVRLSRSTGTDLLTGEGLDLRLDGVSTVIDVTDSPDPAEEAATAFFDVATRNLGAAAARSGVEHLVVLSIVGVDLVPGGYYAAKLAQEAAARESFGLGTVILRATQFHEFAEQTLAWGTDGSRCLVQDMPVQPIALATVVDELVSRVRHPDRDGDLAGPQRESLTDMVRRLIAHTGAEIEVAAEEVDQPLRDGALLGGPAARIGGPTFQEWLARR